MKKLFLVGAVALLASCAGEPETGYTVNVNVTGDLTKLPSDTLVFAGGTKATPVSDTVVLVNGKATIKGETNTPTNYTISFLKGKKRTTVKRFFLENEKYDINVDAEDLKTATVVTTAAVQTHIEAVNAKRNELYAANNIDSLLKVYGKLTKEEQEKVREAYNKCNEEVKAMDNAFIEANPTSVYALSTFASEVGDLPVADLDAKVATFDTVAAYANNEMLKEVKETVALIKSLQPGQKAPDFVQNDPDGKPVKFSDIYSKNKLTMVDFWASWCGPCRAFNPDLVKIYKKYHKKGFEILGVSHDRDYDAWVKGIKDDKLTWPQVSDLKFWDNEVGRMYYVRYIPQNIFVDQNGIIVGRQIDKPEVANFIDEFLKK
ncbi:MAG: AhpC/TSA family protein [Bacteroidales bacterium]|nr:AhpC/TSA family protein [Bacteroidales bacterium]MBQ8645388.1 AhpC/TSA family protein [Bacteroidales bacterium]